MGFKTVAAFKTVKSWGHMQYVILSYDIGKIYNNHQDIVTSFHLLKNQVDWEKMSELRIFLCDKVNFLENKPFGQIGH